MANITGQFNVCWFFFRFFSSFIFSLTLVFAFEFDGNVYLKHTIGFEWISVEITVCSTLMIITGCSRSVAAWKAELCPKEMIRGVHCIIDVNYQQQRQQRPSLTSVSWHSIRQC